MPFFIEWRMPAFLFRCPITGLQVQGWTDNDPSETSEHTFESITCHACGQVHLVNPKTGRTPADKREDK
jgi:hypothetical protein